MLYKEIQSIENLSKTKLCSPFNHFLYIIPFFSRIKSANLLEMCCLSKKSLSFSYSNIKFYLRIHPIADIFSPISKIHSSDCIIFSRISNYIFITWVINSRTVVFKTPRPCSHEFPMIIWIGNLKVIRSILIPYDEIFRMLFHSFGSCLLSLVSGQHYVSFLVFISSALILFIKWDPMWITNVT